MIGLHHILPGPLADRDLSASEIWGRNVELENEKLVHIYAPSGTGKSTFIHILYGLRNDYTGDYSLDGKTISQKNHHTLPQLRKEKFSIVFQDLRLFPQMTLWDNLAIKSSLTNTTSDDGIKEMCTRLGIGELLQRTCGTLSLGEQQRVAIVRSLCQPFQWLLLDEPFSHLDEANIDKAKNLILETCKKNHAGCVLASLGFEYDLPYDVNYKL